MGIDDIFDEHLAVLQASQPDIPRVISEVVSVVRTALISGGKILLCGNGGSAADAQHFAAECVARFERERIPLAAIALTTDTSLLTATANDYGYQHVFARQVRALARAGDVLFAVSTSGNSPNVMLAAEAARRLRCHVVAFTGQGGGKLAELADTLVAIPSTRVARVQELHELCLHAIASELDAIASELENAPIVRDL
jgi:D-sedoheptulose 7-phosphate isomerase